MLKKFLKSIVETGFALMRSNSFGRRIHSHLIRSAFKTTVEVQHEDVRLKFCAPNGWARKRAETFSEKEPETLEWIDKFPKGSVFWDVGANLGLYSLYASLKVPDARVFAFEPSVFNLELLARNIVLNSLQENITLMPMALSESSGIDTLHMSMTEWGGAMSTFGQTYTYDGKPMDEVFAYRLPACSLDDLANFYGIPKPTALKMDVDGIEHLILKGGANLLKDPALQTILIEVNDNFPEQREGVKTILEAIGWQMLAKRHGDWIDDQSESAATFNQIWGKK